MTSSELSLMRKKNHVLTKKLQTLEADLQTHRLLLQKTFEEQKPAEIDLTKKELNDTLVQISRAALGRVSSQDVIANETLDRHIGDLADIIKEGRGRVAKKTEVQQNIQHNPTQAAPQITDPRTQPTRNRLSRFIRSADLK